MAALWFFLQPGYLKAQRKKLSFVVVVFLVLLSYLAAVSVYGLLTFLYFWAELRWSMVWILQNTSPQNAPGFSALKNRNYQEIACFLPTLCFADAEEILGEESSLNFTSWIWSVYQHSHACDCMQDNRSSAEKLNWIYSPILAHSYWHTFLYYN